MIDTLHIGNFKAFATNPGGRTIDVPLRPITLIFGRNSSGKSTLLQALLTLQQAWEQPGALPDDLVLEGTRVRLGTLRNVIHGQDTSLRLRLGVGVGGKKAELHFSSVTEEGFGRLAALDFEVDGKGDTSSKRIVRFAALVRDAKARDVVRLRLHFMGSESSMGLPSEYPIGEEDGDTGLQLETRAVRDLLEDLGLGAPLDLRWLRLTVEWADDRFDVTLAGSDDAIGWAPVTPRVLAGDGQADFLLRTRLRSRFASVVSAAESCERIRHVGRTRVWQDRRFSCSPTPLDDVGESGAATASVLWHSPEVLQTVNTWLADRLECPLRCDVERWDATGTDATIRLSPVDAESVRVGLPDVGSGVSQILPVLVQLALADPRLVHNAERPGMVVLVQQPELHLHPRMQVLFARLLVDLVTEWDRYLAAERRPDHIRPQVILETHSKEVVESFVNDIAAMDDDSEAEGAQCSTALHRLISLIYVSQVGGAARVKEITINRNGDFEDEWPDGFFTRRAIFGPSTRGGV